ncbi:MAG: HAD family hydrolase [Geothrix sp.]|uniref:HAD family hydrolase n=1 Tax=Geothrix sp. TaxID=1962974 RepID=UPI00178DC1F6|nr:HAD family hydrolase [Geothrix sp.]NWJ39420.1 HAD family hydrolase [Geothrix sp.]WIL19355.1 MAG: HAD family hydrolase [Geothrix sp.]
MLRVLAFDADDTLWHNETHYAECQEAFRDLLRAYHDDAWIDARLHDTEMRNLHHYGYGIKGFTLSMIETALELTEERLDGAGIRRVVELGKAMLSKPVEPLPGVAEVLQELSTSFDLMVITKGDLFDQETKLARSGLGPHFSKVEIVSEKDEAAYAAILTRHGLAPGSFTMVGNSVRSDILPVLALGARAVHIPYALTWAHEAVATPLEAPFPVLESIRELPALLAGW